MADIFSEVEEELRRDKYNTLLRRFGLPILVLALLLIVAVGLHQMVWEPWRMSRIHVVSDAYEAAVSLRQAGRTEEAEAAFDEIAAGEHEGYAALALIQQGQMAEEAGDPARASALYLGASDMAGDGAVGGLARIKALYAMAETAAYDEILGAATPLIDEGSPYQYSARELVAAAALKAGDLDRARREYQYLSLAPETPPGIRVRAGEGLAAVELAADTTAPAAEESPS